MTFHLGLRYLLSLSLLFFKITLASLNSTGAIDHIDVNAMLYILSGRPVAGKGMLVLDAQNRVRSK